MAATQRMNQEREVHRWKRWTIGLGVLALSLGAAAIIFGQAPAPAAAMVLDDEPAFFWEAVPSREAPAATATPAPTATRQPIATAAPRLIARRQLVKRLVAEVSPKPAAPVTPLNFSFYAYTVCATRKIQNLTLMITAHGGRPPYTYYNDSVVLGQSVNGSVKYGRDAPAGNPVPYKIIVVDSTGQRYSEDFFFKSHLKCGY